MKIKVQCLVLSRRKVPKSHVTRLCEMLFKVFSKNARVKKARPKSPEFSYLSVVFMDKPQARKLNRQYRRKDYPTDILSFAPDEKGMGLGELVLCEPVIRRQAKEHGLSFTQEMDYLLIHGFLHLLGYDHEKSRKEEAKMMRLQDKLFKKLSTRR